MDNKNLLCFTAPSWLFLLFPPKPSCLWCSSCFLLLMLLLFLALDVSSLWCSWAKIWCWVALKTGWAGNQEPNPADGADPVLALSTPFCFCTSHPHLLLRRGCWWFSWAQTWAHLHLLLLIPSYYHTCPFPCSETSAEGAVSLEPGVMIWGGECWE